MYINLFLSALIKQFWSLYVDTNRYILAPANDKTSDAVKITGSREELEISQCVATSYLCPTTCHAIHTCHPSPLFSIHAAIDRSCVLINSEARAEVEAPSTAGVLVNKTKKTLSQAKPASRSSGKMETRTAMYEIKDLDDRWLFDLGHPFLNRIAASFIKATGVLLLLSLSFSFSLLLRFLHFTLRLVRYRRSLAKPTQPEWKVRELVPSVNRLYIYYRKWTCWWELVWYTDLSIMVFLCWFWSRFYWHCR